MAVVTKLTKRIEHPRESGQHLTIRMLSFLELEDARQARLGAIAEQATKIADLRQAMQGTDVATARAGAQAVQEDPTAMYDVGTLLKHGVVQWSYPDEVQTELLDEFTATWAAKEILAYSRPSDDDLKNGSPLSTGTS